MSGAVRLGEPGNKRDRDRLAALSSDERARVEAVALDLYGSTTWSLARCWRTALGSTS